MSVVFFFFFKHFKPILCLGTSIVLDENSVMFLSLFSIYSLIHYVLPTVYPSSTLPMPISAF